MTAFPDHFSTVAQGYSAYRPRYPSALFDALVNVVAYPESRAVDGSTLVWDCAAGTGQASVALGERFQRVFATDASASQIRQAEAHACVQYTVATAEHCPLRSGSVSLVTVAQALHWFQVDAFYREATRVLRPGGVLAVWCYGLLRVDENHAVERVIDRFSEVTLGRWWPPERRHVDAAYADLPFPFAPIAVPPVNMTARWSMPELLGYVRTWSAVNRKRAADSADPVAALEPELAEAWGNATNLRMRWPVTVRVGRST